MAEELPWWLFNNRRSGPLDYLVSFDHRDPERARRAVLWDGEWEAQTTAVISALRARGVVPGALVLDLGCGVGRLLPFLGPRVIGTDRSAEMLRHARAACPNAVLVSPDAALAPGSAYDVVVAVEVLQHVPAPILRDLLPVLATVAPRLVVWGNATLDVGDDVGDDGVVGTESVRDAIARAFQIVEDSVIETVRGPRFLLDACAP